MGEGKTEAACIAACFGRQDPRPDASPLMAKDTLFTFGDGARQARWIHCFSMASSCIRRSVWQTMRFSETLKYSEDIDWTWRARQAGCRIVYRPGSAVFHSHNYTLRQLHKRQFGEGYAEAEIFDLPEARRGFFRYSLLPWGRLVFSDIAWCVPRGKIGAAFFSPVARAVMSAGRLKGFKTAVASKSGAAQSRVVKSGEAKSDVGGKVSGGPQ